MRPRGRAARSPFLGREAELAALWSFLDSGRRLVAVIGPGGAGKSRLVQALIDRRLREAFHERLWVVDLAAARGAGGLLRELAFALDVSFSLGSRADSTLAATAAYLRAQGRASLVVDNAETAADEGMATLSALLDAAPELVAVVTSRERPRLDGECVLELGPLPVPDEGADPGAIRASPSVALFLERAAAARPAHAPSDEDLVRIADIVRRVDGMPLAIELAASKMAVLDARGLASRIGADLSILKSALRDASPRGSSVDGSIASSFETLTPREAAALEACSCFRGGFDLEAAEAVLEPGEGTSVLELLERLRDRSLLSTREDEGGGVRFVIYQTIGDYARSRLEARDAAAADALWRHARYFASRGLRDAEDYWRTGTRETFLRAARERENLFACWHHLAERDGPGDLLLAAALALDPIAAVRGPLDEHASRLERALRAPRQDVRARSTGLARLGGTLLAMGRTRDARALLRAEPEPGPMARAVELTARAELEPAEEVRSAAEELIEAARASDDASSELRARLLRTELQSRAGSVDEAPERAGIAASFAARGAVEDGASATLALARAHAESGRPGEALACLRRGRVALDRVAAPALAVQASILAARALVELGEAAPAAAHAREAADAARRIGSPTLLAASQLAIGLAALEAGDLTTAERELRASEQHASPDDFPMLHAECLGFSALAAWEARRDASAMGAMTRAAEIHGALGARLLAGAWSAGLGAARAEIGEATFAAAAHAKARACHAGLTGPMVEAAAIERAPFDLAFPDAGGRGRARSDKQKAVIELIARALAPDPGAEEGMALVKRSFMVRRACRRALRALPNDGWRLAWGRALDPTGRSLVLDPKTRTLRAPSAEWSVLGGKRQLWRLLELLAARSEEQPGATIPVVELVRELWPEERILPDAAAGRVYSAVAQLRRLGMRDLVERAEDGYRLDPSVRVVRVPSAV